MTEKASCYLRDAFTYSFGDFLKDFLMLNFGFNPALSINITFSTRLCSNPAKIIATLPPKEWPTKHSFFNCKDFEEPCKICAAYVLSDYDDLKPFTYFAAARASLRSPSWVTDVKCLILFCFMVVCLILSLPEFPAVELALQQNACALCGERGLREITVVGLVVCL